MPAIAIQWVQWAPPSLIAAAIIIGALLHLKAASLAKVQVGMIESESPSKVIDIRIDRHEDSTFCVGNEFADAYNEWTRLMNHTPEGTIDARATRQWARVKLCWRELEKSVG